MSMGRKRNGENLLAQAQKLIPKEQFSALMSAFYLAKDCDDFLDEAGDLMDTRFFRLNEEMLLALDDKQKMPCRVHIDGWPCVAADAHAGGVYVCTIATDDEPGSIERITAICFLMGLGAHVHGWFADVLGVHPDTYLAGCDFTGGGIYCLYFPAPMSSRKYPRLCLKLAQSTQAKNHYMDEKGFSLILQPEKTRRQQYFNRLAHTILAHGIVAGASGPFMSPSLAIGGYIKAVAAAPALSDSIPLRFMGANRWALMSAAALESIDIQGYYPDDFLTDAFKRILDYDAKNETQYCKNIHEYLLRGKSLSAAAQKLDIHRNTLDNRIARITELFGVDFSNNRVCFELLFSCKLYYDVLNNRPGQKKRRSRIKNTEWEEYRLTDEIEDCDAMAPFKDESAANEFLKRCVIRNRERSIVSGLWKAVLQRSGGIPDKAEDSRGFAAPYRLAYIDASGLVAARRHALYTDMLKLPRAVAAAFDERRVCAVCASSDELENALLGLVGSYDRHAALSSLFGGERLSHHVRLTELCLFAGRRLCPDERLYRFDEHSSSVLFLIAGGRMDLSPYLCDDVLGLIKSDEVRDTEISRSLYEYLLCFTDLRQAADKLNVHRNTLDNHLKKITEVLGGDIDDEKRFEMLLTYNLLALDSK